MARRVRSNLLRPVSGRWYKATEAARLLGFKSTEALRLLRVSGKIHAEIMPNGRWGFPESEINRLLRPVNMEKYISNLCNV